MKRGECVKLKMAIVTEISNSLSDSKTVLTTFILNTTFSRVEICIRKKKVDIGNEEFLKKIKVAGALAHQFPTDNWANHYVV